MTRSHDLVDARRSARTRAELAARQRLLNSYLRETGGHDPRTGDGPEFAVRFPASGRTLTGTLTHWSALGHHVYDEALWLVGADGAAPVPASGGDVVELVLAELAAPETGNRAGNGAVNGAVNGHEDDQRARLAAQIDDSVERTARYLSRRRAPRPGPEEPRALTRHAEQSLLLGHPLHPTPKSAEGFDDEELAAYAPELGASFPLEYLAVSPGLVREERVRPGPWLPGAVLKRARDTAPAGRTLLPLHPWQARYLLRLPEARALVDSGDLTPLGPLGRDVYPTSSVRTVCDPDFRTAWKLPLHVRITNFVRTNPVDQVRRAIDASRLVAACREEWHHPGFEVLVETGFRGLAPPELAAESTVLFREHPFAVNGHAPQVLAALLEEPPEGGEPYLVGHLRESCAVPTGALPASAVADWLTRYLRLSLLPVLDVFASTGVSLEAHVQNALVHLEDGWPTRFYLRDMEGVSVSRRTRALTAAGREIRPDSPVLYDHEEAWHRLQYYAVTNHLGHLVHVLAHHGGTDERRLWSVVARALGAPGAPPGASRLLDAPTLPAKANLSSRFAERGERPTYVRVPNPITR